MRGRLLVAGAAFVLVIAASGSGGSAAEPVAPAYGVIASLSGGAQTLVRVDPATLKPLRGGLAVAEGLAFGARSPDGRSAVFFDSRRPQLQVVDLEKLANRKRILLANGGWRARALAWLTADRVAVVLQKMRGSYAQIVERREIVIVDPFAGRVLSRRLVPGRMALTGSAAAADKLVLLLGRGDARTRTVRVVVVDANGAVRSVDADLGPTRGLRGLAMAVDASGRKAFVVAAGAPVIEIDLERVTATAYAVQGGGAVFAPGSGSRQAIVLGDGNLLVAGNQTGQVRGTHVSRPAGLALIDTSTWQLKLIDPEASGVSVSGDTLLAYSFRIDRATHRGRPIQKVSGIGIRAYAADGSRLWRRYDRQPLIATAFREVAFVHRHASPPVGWGGSFVIGLAQGQLIRNTSGARQNFWLLPDVPGARPVRATAAVREAEALRIEGESAGFQATVRDDVTRVVATLVDGSERELLIEDGRVRYHAATPEEGAQAVQAFAGERLLASISITVSCGGSHGPCAASGPAARGTLAIFRTPRGATLAEIDPRSLKPLPGQSVAIDASTSANALSADGTLAAVGSYSNATVNVFETAKLDQARLVAPLVPGNAGVRALEWLAPNRLVAIVQKYKRRDRRAVSARELVVIDPQRHRVLRRTALPIGRAIVDVQASGGRLVAMLRSSNHRGTGITVLVADAAGSVRSREIQLRQNEGVLPETRLTLERGGKRAFLFAWQHQRGAGGPQPLREIELDRLTVTQRTVTVAVGRFFRPAAFMAWAESFGERSVLLSGAYVPLFRGPARVPAAGIFILDTRRFKIRQLDARAMAVVISGDRAYTFGATVLPAGAPQRGIGVSAYDTEGKRLYRGFGTRRFARLLVAGGYGHLLRGDRPTAVAFELASGRAVGTSTAPSAEIEVLERAAPNSQRSSFQRRSAAVSAPAAPSDPFTRVSNRGTRVEPKASKRGEREHTPRDLFLLRRDEGRAVYRIGGLKPGYSSCYGSGPGNDLGRLGGLACNRRPGFPSRLQPLLNMSVMQLRRGATTPELYRLEGVAADAITEIGLLDAKQDVIKRVPVIDNVYILARPPAAATGGLIGYDAQGKLVFRSNAPERRAATPAPAATSRTVAGYRIRITLPPGWRGEIRRSTIGKGRAILFAGNRLPTKNPRSAYLALNERDPRARPAFPPIAEPPQLRAEEIRRIRFGHGRLERSFTLKGRQFTLQLNLGTARPSTAALAEINRALATLYVGAIAVPATPRGRPVQKGTDNGVSIEVYRTGIVIFRFDPTSKLYRQLRGKQLSVACLTFDSVSPWEPNQSGFSNRSLAPTVQFIFDQASRPASPYATVDPETEAKPPFDGCLVSGSYGRRWNDPRGQRSPAEIAFTQTGRRFFDERAIARDLALFVRSPKLAAARRMLKQGGGAPAASVLARGLPGRVVPLAKRGTLPRKGEIGVWSDGDATIEVSARSSAGKRLFVELREGRIAQHNLEGLAFVF